jgi:apolipoprotein N-acyltransferase
MGITLIILSALLFTAANYLGQLYILNWIALLPFLYYIFISSKFNYKQLFIRGWFLGFFILLFSGNFLYHSIKLYTSAPFIVIVLLLILLFLFLSLIYGLFLIIYYYLQKKISSISHFNPYLFAALWTAMELSRHYLLGFFPIANPAYTQIEFLSFIQLAEFGGIWILTFIIILSNALLYKIIFIKENRMKNAAVFLIIIFLIFSFGLLRLNFDFTPAAEENISLGLINTQIKQEVKWSQGQLQPNIDLLLNSASDLKKADLIIAPETNITFDFYQNGYYQKDFLTEIEERFNNPLQIGSLASRKGVQGRFNSSFLISKKGEIIDRYDKNLLLYFGETYPFIELLNHFTPYNFSSLNAGSTEGIFEVNNLSWKTVICSEILYPEYVQTQKNMDFIINQTNEAWFNDSRLLKNIMWQAAVIRAVENRIPIIKTGNQAHSGVVYPSGRYKKVDPEFNYHLLKLN